MIRIQISFEGNDGRVKLQRSMKDLAVEVIKEELRKKGITVIKIILFGSRARGDFSENSDWDFLVVIDKELNFNELKKILGEIQWHLATLKIPNDIIIRSKTQFERVQNCVGYISYYASREGIEL